MKNEKAIVSAYEEAAKAWAQIGKTVRALFNALKLTHKKINNGNGGF